jgi:hypothetical protein
MEVDGGCVLMFPLHFTSEDYVTISVSQLTELIIMDMDQDKPFMDAVSYCHRHKSN